MRKGGQIGPPFPHSNRTQLQVTFDLFALEDFDYVVGADVFVVFERHTTFLTGLDFGDVILDESERIARIK